MERTIQLASPKVLGPIFVKEEVVLWNTRELWKTTNMVAISCTVHAY